MPWLLPLCGESESSSFLHSSSQSNPARGLLLFVKECGLVLSRDKIVVNRATVVLNTTTTAIEAGSRSRSQRDKPIIHSPQPKEPQQASRLRSAPFSSKTSNIQPPPDTTNPNHVLQHGFAERRGAKGGRIEEDILPLLSRVVCIASLKHKWNPH